MAVQVSTGGNSDSEGQRGSPTCTQLLRAQAEQGILIRAVVFDCNTVTSGASFPPLLYLILVR